MNITMLIARIRNTADCVVLPPAGLPIVEQQYSLPDDVREFYTLCGGVRLFQQASYSTFIVPPTECALANPVIVGERYEDDISASWYIIAHDGKGDYITIDFDPERVGRCYDSFWDRHAVAGSCLIIAASFTDFVQRILAAQGAHWYWLYPDFVSLGDAYD